MSDRHAYYLTTRGPLPVRILTGAPARHPHRVRVEVTADVGAYPSGHTMAVSSTFLVDRLPHRWSSADDGTRCMRCGAPYDRAEKSCDPHGVRNLTEETTA